MHHNTSRGFGIGVSHSVRFVVSFYMSHSLNSYFKSVSSSQYLGGCRIRRLVCFLFGSSARVCAKIDPYTVTAYTIHPTCPTSPPYSRYSPNTASRPSSHCTRTSGCAAPAGPAHLHGRLSRKPLTSARSCCSCSLPPCSTGETAELRGDPDKKCLRECSLPSRSLRY